MIRDGDGDGVERDAYISPQLDEEFRQRKEQANGKNVPLPSGWSEEKIREYRRWCDRLRKPRKRRATTCAKVDTYLHDDNLPSSLQVEFQERHAAAKGRNVAYPTDWGDAGSRARDAERLLCAVAVAVAGIFVNEDAATKEIQRLQRWLHELLHVVSTHSTEKK